MQDRSGAKGQEKGREITIIDRVPHGGVEQGGGRLRGSQPGSKVSMTCMGPPHPMGGGKLLQHQSAEELGEHHLLPDGC
jgi:hypothetical protein